MAPKRYRWLSYIGGHTVWPLTDPWYAYIPDRGGEAEKRAEYNRRRADKAAEKRRQKIQGFDEEERHHLEMRREESRRWRRRKRGG